MRPALQGGQRAVKNEVEGLGRGLSEALEQQTATSEILRVISSSPTDIQPVLDAIAESAARLCEANDAEIYRVEGNVYRRVAHRGPVPIAGPLGEAYPISRGRPSSRAIIDRQTIHVHDQASEIDTEFPDLKDWAEVAGVRTILATPLLREGVAIGVIGIRRTEVKPFTAKQIDLLQTFADQAVIAIENVRLFKELQEKNRALTEAHAQVTETLEQQTATSEILRVISSSPTDVQPVFDTIVRSAVRLCDGLYGTAVQFDGEMMHLAAGHNYTPEVRQALQEAFPMRPDRRMMAGRAILTRTVIQVEDALDDPEYAQHVARAGGFRGMLAVPMMREGNPIGAIVVNRGQPGPFSVGQIELLQTFADQAVIAIENVRLFSELQEKNLALTEAHAQVTEALEQQTATSEILRVISSSPTDVQPVFDTIVRSAVKLCDGLFSALYQFDGELLHYVAHYNYTPEALEEVRRIFPTRPSRGLGAGRVILERAVVHIPDVELDPEWQHLALSRAIGFRSGLHVPMLREGAPIGVIAVTRAEPGPFSDNEIELLKTFADQAVIAIENVRLFTELQEKNRALTAAHAQVTEALERQTATSEILRVISSSPTDVQPVFDIIGERAERLCAAEVSLVTRFDGELIQLVALHGVAQEGVEAVRQAFPMRCDAETVTARAFRNCAVIHIPDVLADPLYQRKDEARAGGYRGGLGVPMVREGRVVGVIFVARRTPGYFTDSQVELLKTFADQAVIAVENVRLFQELEARTRDLTRSVNELQALSDVGRALSSTLDLETVLRTIVSRANQLAGTDSCSVYEYDDQAEQLLLRATDKLDEAVVAVAQRAPIRRGEGVAGRMAVTREPVQIADIAEPGAYHGPLRDILLRTGTRALLGVPLLREEQLIGGLTVTKKTPGEFSSEVIDLLKTFAAQSALAIQNARLFREIADKSRQLEDASRHKSEFLANMSHELRTPLNAIIGFSEVLNERMFGELNEKQAEYLRDIYASGQHLLSLINDILDLSKVEAGRMELELADFDLSSAIDNALILVRERATRRGITLGRTVDEHLGMLHGDERKVKQVLLNLLSNALKFTPEGGRIDVSARVQDGAVEIAVTDTGVGIATEDQEAVFEEFRQVGTADKKVEGTGLGLALSRKFIELHGGRIWIQSAVGAGSTFTFTLPLRR